MILPWEKLTKVRNLQVHNQTVSTAYAGSGWRSTWPTSKNPEVERATPLAAPGLDAEP